MSDLICLCFNSLSVKCGKKYLFCTQCLVGTITTTAKTVMILSTFFNGHVSWGTWHVWFLASSGNELAHCWAPLGGHSTGESTKGNKVQKGCLRPPKTKLSSLIVPVVFHSWEFGSIWTHSEYCPLPLLEFDDKRSLPWPTLSLLGIGVCQVTLPSPRVNVWGPQPGDLDAYLLSGPDTRTWTTPEVTGPPPSPRTFHTSSAAIGDQLYVFGGGERGAQPVQDVQLHAFDASMDGVGDPWGHHLPGRGCPGLQLTWCRRQIRKWQPGCGSHGLLQYIS